MFAATHSATVGVCLRINYVNFKQPHTLFGPSENAALQHWSDESSNNSDPCGAH